MDTMLSEIGAIIYEKLGVTGAIIVVVIVMGPKYIKEVSAWKKDRVHDKLKIGQAQKALENNISNRLEKKGDKK